MRQFIAPTEDAIKLERGQLSADANAASNVTINVIDNSGMAINGYVVIGWEGSENCEIAKINASVSPGTQIQVDALRLSHKSGEPITVYRYNQRKFYGSLTATGVYVELTGYGSPKDIQVDDPQGTLFEYAGTEGYTYFKATYFNSTTSEETNPSDSIGVPSDQTSRYSTLYAIRKQAGLTNNPYVTDGIVEGFRLRAENEIDSYINSRYTLPLTNSSGVAEIPPLVENMCVLLAAGYMDVQEMGENAEGYKWLETAHSMLKQIQKPGGMQIIGSDKQEMTQPAVVSGVQSYPDQVDNNNGPAQVFTMKQRF